MLAIDEQAIILSRIFESEYGSASIDEFTIL